MNLRTLALATAVTAAVASPALAMGPHARSEAAQQRLQESRIYHHPYQYGYRYGGFPPADIAAGVVGGALGTAGAIAGAPFGYNYYEGPYPYAW